MTGRLGKGRCDRCGAPLEKGRYRRIRSDRRTFEAYPRTQWVTDEFIRYYCPGCAEEVKKAIRRSEMERRSR